jgi:hypothetical protein
MKTQDFRTTGDCGLRVGVAFALTMTFHTW